MTAEQGKDKPAPGGGGENASLQENPDESGQSKSNPSLPPSVISRQLPPGDWESLEQTQHEEVSLPERDSWSSQVDFLMTCISMSVGFGNIYRFPFVSFENGGGAFLIPYIIVMFVVGRPTYFFELLLGQFTSLGCTNVWEMAPIFRGLGYAMALASAFTVTFYANIMAIIILYAIYSFWNPLPWDGCTQKLLLLDGKPRTDVHCQEFLDNVTTTFYFHMPKELDGNICAGGPDCEEHAESVEIDMRGGNGSDAEMFFRFQVMKTYISIEDGIGPPDLYLSLCLLVAWGIIFFLVARGATASGKISWFMAMFPYVIFIILFGVAVSLDHATDGVVYFFTPKWEKLLTVGVWFQAVQQCFFSLGMGFGPVIIFGSYNNFRHKIYRDVWIVGGMDTFTSILAGSTIFAILGNLAKGGDIAKAVTRGPNIAFVSYPSVMRDCGPYPLPQIFSFLFFFMLLILGIGTGTSLATTVVTVTLDRFPRFKRSIVTSVVCTIGYFVGLIYTTPGGSFMVLLIDTFACSLILYVVVVGEVIAVAWVYGLRNFSNDAEFMLQEKLNWYWKTCWGIIIPFGLLFVLVYNFITFETPAIGDSPLPDRAIAVGGALSGLILSVIPCFAVSVVITRKTKSLYKKFRASLHPTRKWGPKDPDLRTAWEEFKEDKPYRYHPWKIFTPGFWKKRCKWFRRRNHSDSAAPGAAAEAPKDNNDQPKAEGEGNPDNEGDNKPDATKEQPATGEGVQPQSDGIPAKIKAPVEAVKELAKKKE